MKIEKSSVVLTDQIILRAIDEKIHDEVTIDRVHDEMVPDDHEVQVHRLLEADEDEETVSVMIEIFSKPKYVKIDCQNVLLLIHLRFKSGSIFHSDGISNCETMWKNVQELVMKSHEKERYREDHFCVTSVSIMEDEQTDE